jgi:hypothetical protein
MTRGNSVPIIRPRPYQPQTLLLVSPPPAPAGGTSSLRTGVVPRFPSASVGTVVSFWRSLRTASSLTALRCREPCIRCRGEGAPASVRRSGPCQAIRASGTLWRRPMSARTRSRVALTSLRDTAAISATDNRL